MLHSDAASDNQASSCKRIFLVHPRGRQAVGTPKQSSQEVTPAIQIYLYSSFSNEADATRRGIPAGAMLRSLAVLCNGCK